MKPSNTCALRRLTRGLAACAITLAMLGCGGGGGGGGDTGAAGDETGGSEIPAAPALKLLPGRLGLAIGDNGALFATGAAAATTWQSSDATVAAVDQLGRVKALAKGSAVITATFAAAVATSTVTVYRTDGVTPDPTSESLIADALAAKRIDAETALRYGIFSIFGDERPPAAFEGAPSTVPQHLLLRQMATTIASLSPATSAAPPGEPRTARVEHRRVRRERRRTLIPAWGRGPPGAADQRDEVQRHRRPFSHRPLRRRPRRSPMRAWPAARWPIARPASCRARPR